MHNLEGPGRLRSGPVLGDREPEAGWRRKGSRAATRGSRAPTWVGERTAASVPASPPRGSAGLLPNRPAEEGGAAQPRGRKSARSFRRAEMTRGPRFRVGSRRRIPGLGDPGSRQRGGPRAQGWDASPRGGSRRHRQEEAGRGEERKADPQQPPTRERLKSWSRALFPSNRAPLPALPSQSDTGCSGPGERRFLSFRWIGMSASPGPPALSPRVSKFHDRRVV